MNNKWFIETFDFNHNSDEMVKNLENKIVSDNIINLLYKFINQVDYNFFLEKKDLSILIDNFIESCQNINNTNNINKIIPSLSSIYIENNTYGVILKKIIDYKSNIIIIGDLYGSLESLSRILINMYGYKLIDENLNIKDKHRTNIVILGNLFSSSVDEITTNILEINFILMKLKTNNPNNVHILQSKYNDNLNYTLYRQLEQIYKNEQIDDIHKKIITMWKYQPCILLMGIYNNEGLLKHIHFSQGGHDNKINLKDIIENEEHEIITKYEKYKILSNSKWNSYCHDIYPFDIKTHKNTHIYGIGQAINYCKKYNIKCIIKGSPNYEKRFNTKIYLTNMDTFNKIYKKNKNIFENITKAYPIYSNLLEENKDEYFIEKKFITSNFIINDIESNYNKLNIAPIYCISSNKEDYNNKLNTSNFNVLSFSETNKNIFRNELIINYIKNKNEYDNQKNDLIDYYNKLIILYKNLLNNKKNNKNIAINNNYQLIDSSIIINNKISSIFKKISNIKFTK